MSDEKTQHAPYEIIVSLDRDELVVFEPQRLNVFAEDDYSITFRLDAKEQVTFDEPYIDFKDKERAPFTVRSVSEDSRSFELRGRNREEGLSIERYPYQVVLSLRDHSHKSPDPSIIHHGTDGGSPAER